MKELKSSKVPQVKTESRDRQEIMQPPLQYPFHHQPIPAQNFYVDFQTLLKNPFENQMAYGYNWMNAPQFQENPYPFYGCVDPYYGNQNYSMNHYPSYSNKLHEETIPLAPTSASLVPSNPYGVGMSYAPYSSIPSNLSGARPNLNYSLCVQQDDFDISEPHYHIKVEQDSSLERQKGIKRMKSKMKNQTKNIPKNYGKAMISFILSHLDWIQSEFGIQRREQLVSELKKRKNSINAIVHLKDLWTTSKYAKEFRILSNLFLRKYSFAYIFNSRVSNYSTHIKYKYKLQEALRSPGTFSRIKEY